MDGVGTIGICLWINLLPKLMPMVSRAAVVKAMESIATVTVGEHRRITITMATVKGALHQLILGTRADLNPLCDLDAFFCKELFQIERSMIYSSV